MVDAGGEDQNTLSRARGSAKTTARRVNYLCANSVRVRVYFVRSYGAIWYACYDEDCILGG